MTHAYATIAAMGVRRPMLAFTKVQPFSGKATVIKPAKNHGHRVLPDGAPWQLTQYLDTNVHSCCTGTNANVQLSGLAYRDQAGKTGTTDNHTDAWFCGYTPNLAACVWVGYPQGEVSMENLGGTIPGPAFGGGYPATIWRLFAAAAFQTEPGKFPPTLWETAPQNPVQYRPFTSQFSLPTPPAHGGGGGSSGKGSSSGGSSSTGGGTSGTTGTSQPPTSTTPPPPTSTPPPTT
jgi:membrane peptidoglycan carboxypeptidase